jgi:hypothetical protein
LGKGNLRTFGDVNEGGYVILKTSTPILLFTISIALLLQGCVIPTRLSAVPENAIADAEVPGINTATLKI